MRIDARAVDFGLVTEFPIGATIVESLSRFKGRIALWASPRCPEAFIARAEKQSIPVHRYDSLNSVSTHEDICEKVRKAIVVCGCREILNGETLARMPVVVNIHPSLLPAHRGPTPVFWTIRNGDAWSGVTVHRMAEKIDAGEILLQRVLAIPTAANHDLLFGLLREEAYLAFEQILKSEAQNSRYDVNASAHYAPLGSYEKRPSSLDRTIVSDMSHVDISRLIRACDSIYPVEIPSLGFSGKLSLNSGDNRIVIPLRSGDIVAWHRATM